MKSLLVVGVLALGAIAGEIVLPPLPAGYDTSKLPPGRPQTPPAYMVNNVGNTYGVAPDKGTQDGPVRPFANYDPIQKNGTRSHSLLQTSGFWMDGIAHGKMPFAPSEYQFFRNVKDFGAVGDGVTDDTAAINRAVVAMSSSNLTPARCGETCASTSTLGALVYFPPGTYLISKPIIQYYYTQFVGDVNNRPTIKGTKDFAGIALIDTDVYIPGGDGAEWYINQSQFYRQIRNFIFDMTAMNRTNHDLANSYVPTGIHWQVGQATSLQNLHFEMPLSDSDGAVTHVGIFMENGSGGFLSDLTFFGGAIGFRAGTQQYTARNLSFTLCLTAVSSIWNWGFTWKNIYVKAVYIAIDCTNVGGLDSQGTGSITVLDSHFDGVPYPITLRAGGPYPNIVLDNLLVENSASIVLVSGGETILPGSTGQLYFSSWGMGRRYSSIDGAEDPGDSDGFVTGFISPTVVKPRVLLDNNGNIFERSKPQYESMASGGFLVATEFGIANDGTGDQAMAINNLLIGAGGTPVFFPAGIYQVKSTVHVPVGSIIVGEGWSQIMGTGSFFEDADNPQVMVQVGNAGDYGDIEISDMLFTGNGPTAGMILMEWNVQAASQGSAGMWDSHFRVGGAQGSNLQSGDCPTLSGVNPNCKAAFMLLHVTASGNGYFENVWAWVADHDLDDDRNAQATEGLDGVPRNVLTQVSIYAARGVLIESSGPCWFYGTASEHSMFYQYQLQGASNIYLGHMQTETPYFQPEPDATQVYKPGQLSGDPTWSDCSPGTTCEDAFALRVINSSSILIYGAGFYSFFNNYEQTCVANENCQERLIQTDCTDGLWMYNVWTKGSVEVVSPMGLPPALQANNQNGYTTEISAWLVLAGDGSSICSSGSSGSGVIYIDPIIFVEPEPVVAGTAPCTFVFPTSGLSAATVITPPPYETSVDGTTITTLTPGPITVSVISFMTLSIPSGVTESSFALTSVIQPPPTTLTVGSSTTVFFPPYVVGPLNGTTSTTYYTLPTTVVTISGTKYTYSEQQITSLANVTTSFTSSTIFPDTDVTTSSTSSTSTTTPVPIWIQAGGFYWSPVPKPTGPPLPKFPPLPGFPPIPNPPCFKFLGIFIIDCPPNKGNPTTRFHKGPPSPTCKKDCGTLPGPSRTSTECVTTTQTINGTPHVGCEPEPTETSIPCDISTETGLCENGNFPVWDPDTNSLNCDDNNDEAAEDITDCQASIDADLPDAVAQIECELEESTCPAAAKRDLLEDRQAKKPCRKRPAYYDDPTPAEEALGCDAAFLCDTDKWPNVCLNAKSAQDLRGKPSALTFYGERHRYGYDVTSDWYITHEKLGIAKKTRNNDILLNSGSATSNGVKQPWGGWGLYGCEVEEYPFGNSLAPGTAPNPITWNDRSVLRLIPQSENANHGSLLGAFTGYGVQQFGNNFVYCVRVTGGFQPADYGLDAAQTHNMCGQAYGPGFLLVNDITAQQANAAPNGDRRWDPWFDRESQLFEHTIYSQTPPPPSQGPAYVRTTFIPSQYGSAPAPGHKTYNAAAGVWTTAAPGGALIGKAVAREAQNEEGTNLKWDMVGVAHTNSAGGPILRKRSPFSNPLGRRAARPNTELEETYRHNQTAAMDMASLVGRSDSLSPRRLSERQLGKGSFLDPRVYVDALGCALPDYDDCFLNVCVNPGSQYGPNDGELKPGSPTTPYPHGGGSGSGTITTGPTARPTLGCVPGADPDSGATTAYCNCPGAGSILPTLTTGTDECGYTAIPFICQTKTVTDSSSSIYCACNGYPGTLPILSPTFTPYDPCGYTTVPNPWPYTSTDSAGDVIGCRSSTSSTNCVGPSTTLYSAPPPPTSVPTSVPQYTFAMWREFDYSIDDVDGHVHNVLDGITLWAGSVQDPCRERGTYEAQDPKSGLYLNGVSASMLFKNGICGVASSGILCTSSDDKNWSCKNQAGIGNVVATCQRLSDNTQMRACTQPGEEVILIKNLVCTGDINCDA